MSVMICLKYRIWNMDLKSNSVHIFTYSQFLFDNRLVKVVTLEGGDEMIPCMEEF